MRIFRKTEINGFKQNLSLCLIQRVGEFFIKAAFSVRYVIILFLFIVFGSLSLNDIKSIDEQGVGGYSAMEEIEIVPVFFGEEFRYFDDRITSLLENRNFNGNVLIARHGIVYYNRSFGYANFRSRAPLNDTTAFQVASIGKTFTASAVLLLYHRGLLDLDDYVVNHISEFPYPKITIRHLLTHTSGLQNYMWLIENRWQSTRIPTNEDMLNLFVQHTLPVNFQPGQRFDYSNTGYAFLALLIERVSGKSYSEFIQNEIFDPVGMNHSFANDLSNPVDVENKAYGYRRFRNSYIRIPHNYIDGVLGDKGIYSTVIDLYKWDRALYNNSLLPEHLRRKAFDYARLNNNRTVNYGLGWRLQTFLDKKVVHHPGRWNGYRTSFKRYIDDQTTIIVLSNTNRDVMRLVDELQLIVFRDEVIQFTANNESFVEEHHENEVLMGGIESRHGQP